METAPTIRPLHAADLPEITRIHVEAFADSAMTRLGPDVVHEYYRWQLAARHPQFVGFVADVDGRTGGFLIGGVLVGAQSMFVHERWRLLLWHVVKSPRNWGSPLIWERTAVVSDAVRRRVRRRAEEVRTATRPPRFGILAIATDGRARGRGVASALLDAAEDVARTSGFSEMYLSVHTDNDVALGVYEHLGWTKRLEGGEFRGSMVKRLGA